MNSIGLPQEETTQITKKLNELLASYSVLYMNTRGFHWNIQGKEFFELHQKFEDIYNTLVVKIDEIAERILTLEGTPEHSFTSYLKLAKINPETDITDGNKALSYILEGYKTVIGIQREILTAASDINDEGTVTLMSDYITAQEKEI
jgi:starvation-inducible DNA-binding protein